jgi:glutathione S-transferase
MLKILGRNNSSNVQKVLWCCAELGLAFEREDYGGPFGKTKEEPYLTLNPNSVVPTVIDDDLVLWESNTIIRYLAAKHGEGTLLPADLGTRALGERWMDWQLSVINKFMPTVFMGLIRTAPEDRNNEAIATARDGYENAMAILDRYLGETAYVAGADFSLGDIPVGIMAYRWFNLDIKRKDLPNLKRWFDLIGTRPGYKEHVEIGLS